MGEHSHEVKRALGFRIEIGSLAGHTDRTGGVVIMDGNTKTLIAAKIAGAGHDIVRGRIEFAIVTRVPPFEWVQRIETMARDRIGRAEVLAVIELEPFRRPAIGDGCLRERLAATRYACHDVAVKAEIADDSFELGNDAGSAGRRLDRVNEIQRPSSPIWLQAQHSQSPAQRLRYF